MIMSPRSFSEVTVPRLVHNFWICPKDTGYPHDGRADNAAYRHDRRADKRRYPHDREIDIQMLKMFRNEYISS